MTEELKDVAEVAEATEITDATEAKDVVATGNEPAPAAITATKEEPKAEVETTDVKEAEEAEEEESGLTDEEAKKMDRIVSLVNDRCFVMHECMSGAVAIVLDIINEDLGSKKATEIAVDAAAQFSQFGAGPPDINKQIVLSTSAMLASKLYETIVAKPKPTSRMVK